MESDVFCPAPFLVCWGIGWRIRSFYAIMDSCLNYSLLENKEQAKSVAELLDKIRERFSEAVSNLGYNNIPISNEQTEMIVRQVAVDMIFHYRISHDYFNKTINATDYSHDLCSILYETKIIEEDNYEIADKQDDEKEKLRNSIFRKVSKFAKDYNTTIKETEEECYKKILEDCIKLNQEEDCNKLSQEEDRNKLNQEEDCNKLSQEEDRNNLYQKNDYWNLKSAGTFNDTTIQHVLVWDFCYINQTMITSKQYKGTFTKKNGNNSTSEIINGLNEYNLFVNKFLHFKDSDPPERKYQRLIRYYAIESYKRIDHFLAISTNLSYLNSTDVNNKHFFDKKLLKPIKSLTKTDVKRLISSIKMDITSNKFSEYSNKISKLKHYSPNIFLEQKTIQTMISVKKELLLLYENNYLEIFLNHLFDYLDANEEPSLSCFLNDYLDEHYTEQIHYIERSDIYQFLTSLINSFINDQDTVKEFICKWYKHMFTDFAEALEKKYEIQLEKYKEIRAELFDLVNFEIVFYCYDYNEINNFLINEYGIYNIRQTNDRIWKLISDNKVRSNELKGILKNFMNINQDFAW